MNTPCASLIISTWNGRRLLESNLPYLLAAVAEDGGDHEVIVVDDASSDDTVEFMRREFPQVRLLALERNLRFAGANNAGAHAAKGEILVFLNNDMLVEPGFLKPLLRHFHDPSVFAVTSYLQMAPTASTGGIVKETGLVHARFEGGFFVLKHEDPTSEESIPALYAGGGSSAWRRDRFLQLGGFDRLFRPFYFEDIDLSYRAQKGGGKILFEPASRMIHQHRQTNNPRNFPGNYVELAFRKNSLLFTWKVITDQQLLNEHFRALWWNLMYPAINPLFGAYFFRAVAQLPELLLKRSRARDGNVRSDRQVLALSTDGPIVEAAEAGALPYGSTGAGNRVLVIGFSPLPFEHERKLNALSFRTWHIAQALLADGHKVTVVGVRGSGAYEDEAARPPVLKFRGQHFSYYSIEHSHFEHGKLLAQICEAVQPQAIIAIHAYCAWIASRLKTDALLWADLNGYAMAEAQARAALENDDAPIKQAWQWEKTALSRADAFSVVSMRQKYTLIGELAAIGRLSAGNYGNDLVHYVPNAIENRTYRHQLNVLRGRLVGDDDFVILWSGGYNTWTDVDTLFDGLSAAMREEPRIKFVSLGGAMPGRDETTFYRFRQRIEESELAERFVFIGWAPNDEVPNYYFESDVGINIDRFSYEMLIGCRYRILDMLHAGLPVITTLGTEISHVVQDERLGVTFTPGDANGLKEAILTLAYDEALRRRCGVRAKDYVFKHRLAEQVLAPLLWWVRKPIVATDRLPISGESLEVMVVPQKTTIRGLSRAVIGGFADLLSKALVKRQGLPKWGRSTGQSLQNVLIVRAGSVQLVRDAADRMRESYPEASLQVLSPASLAAETGYETRAEVIMAPDVDGVSYRIRSAPFQELYKKVYDLLLVAGEGNRRAELLALLTHARRRIEIREDGAAHRFWLAPYKPLILLGTSFVSIIEKMTLSVMVAAVWASISAEGVIWKMRANLASKNS